MSIRCVFLDVDGTTVDSEPRNRRAIEEAARVGGHKIKEKDWDFLGGQGDNVIWSLISQLMPDFKEVFNTAASFERACLNTKLDRIHEIKKIEEVFEAISLFRRNGIKIAPVSNSITPDALASLEHAGYSREDFVFCLFRDDLVKKNLRAKPYPDPYREALRMMNASLRQAADESGEDFTDITPAECLVFEDSKTGVRSGLAAGMNVLHIAAENEPRLDEEELEQLKACHGGRYVSTPRPGVVDISNRIIQNGMPDDGHAQCHISTKLRTPTAPGPTL